MQMCKGLKKFSPMLQTVKKILHLAPLHIYLYNFNSVIKKKLMQNFLLFFVICNSDLMYHRIVTIVFYTWDHQMMNFRVSTSY
jgi:hypothetical protein